MVVQRVRRVVDSCVSFFNTAKGSQERRRDQKRRQLGRAMSLEGLECRQLMAYGITMGLDAANNPTVQVEGTENADEITLATSNDGRLIHNLQLSGNLVSAYDVDSETPGEQSAYVANIRVVVNSLDGDDSIDLSGLQGALATVNSGSGNDVVSSSSQASFSALDGGAGYDVFVTSGMSSFQLAAQQVSMNGVVSTHQNIEGWLVDGTDGADDLQVASGEFEQVELNGLAGDDYLSTDVSAVSLKGGLGNDQLRAQARSYRDGYFPSLNGDWGNDTYLIEGGSSLSAGVMPIDNLSIFNFDGNDKVIIQAPTGSTVNLVASTGTRPINFSGITELVVEPQTSGSARTTVNLNEAQISAMANNGTLVIRPAAGVDIVRESGWSYSGTEGVGNALLKVLTKGAATLKIEQQVEAGSTWLLPRNTPLESMVIGSHIATMTSISYDPDAVYSYSFAPNAESSDNQYFTLVNGELYVGASLDGSRTSYSLLVRVTDADGVAVDRVVDLDLTGGPNLAPTNVVLSNNQISENSLANSAVGSFLVTDPNVGDSYAVTLVTGTGSDDNAAFAVDGNQLRANSGFNFEAKSNYSVRVRVTDADGLSVEKVLSITITDLNESPTDVAISNSTIPENSAVGTEIGEMSSFDPDANDPTVYTLVAGSGSSGNQFFSIQGNKLIANSSFNFEEQASYSIRVRAEDQQGEFFEKVLVISVGDVDEDLRFPGSAGNDSYVVSVKVDGSMSLTQNGTVVGLTSNPLPGGMVVLDAAGGTDSLKMVGGAGNEILRLDGNKVTINGVVFQFINMESVALSGGSGDDTLTVANGPAAGVSMSFDGGQGNDRIEAVTGSNSWHISSKNAGDLNQSVDFLNMETLAGGTGNDQFVLSNLGSFTGVVVGGDGADLISFAAKAAGVTVNLQSSTATAVGSWSGIEEFIGSSNRTLPDELIGASVATRWDITGVNSGFLSSTSTGQIQFSDFEKVTGGTAADEFVFANAGTVTSLLNGGAGTNVTDRVDLSAKLADLTVQLNTTNGVSNVINAYSGVELMIGNHSAGSSIVRSNSTTTNWSVNADGQVLVGGVTYTNYSIIGGGVGVDTLTGPALTSGTCLWAVNSLNGGTLGIPAGTIAFSGIDNLVGNTGADAFEISPTGGLSGNLNGGTGAGFNSLSYQQWLSSVNVNLNVTTAGNATAVGNLTSNFQFVTGGNGDDQLQGPATKSTTLVGLGGNDRLIGGGNRDLLIGGLGSDTVTGNSGDDLLIGGSTVYDTNREALTAIFSEWISARSFAQRIDNLLGSVTSEVRANQSYFLTSEPSASGSNTVLGDNDVDTLMGGANQDWFLAKVEDITDFVGSGSSADRRN